MMLRDLLRETQHTITCARPPADTCICGTTEMLLAEDLRDAFKFEHVDQRLLHKIQAFVRTWLMISIEGFRSDDWVIAAAVNPEATLTLPFERKDNS